MQCQAASYIVQRIEEIVPTSRNVDIIPVVFEKCSAGSRIRPVGFLTFGNVSDDAKICLRELWQANNVYTYVPTLTGVNMKTLYVLDSSGLRGIDVRTRFRL